MTTVRTFLLVTLAVTFSIDAEEPGRADVAFFGNSMTWFNGMPSLVQHMIDSSEPAAIRAVPIIQSMQTLRGHWRSGGTKFFKGFTGSYAWLVGDITEDLQTVLEKESRRNKAPKDGNDACFVTYRQQAVVAARSGCAWRHVVLQTWSDEQQPTEECLLRLRLLAGIVRDRGGIPVVYQPGGFQQSSLIGRKRAPDFADAERIAAATGLLVLPAEETARLVLQEHPDIVMHSIYMDGDVHPGPRGSYLIACLNYAGLTGVDPTGLPQRAVLNQRYKSGSMKPEDEHYQLTDAEATAIQQAAWTVYQRMQQHVTDTLPPAPDYGRPLAFIVGQDPGVTGEAAEALPAIGIVSPRGYARAERVRDELDRWLGGEQWRICYLNLGYADAVAGTDLKEYAADLEAICAELRKRQTEVVWAGGYIPASKQAAPIDLVQLASYNRVGAAVVTAAGGATVDLQAVAHEQAQSHVVKAKNAEIKAADQAITGGIVAHVVAALKNK